MKKINSILFALCAAVSIAAPAAAAEEFALEKLNASPRHHEWAEVESGGRKVHSFVAFPEKAEKALVVIVIHENRGLTDWVRSFADQLAEAGYIAIAPDLLSGFSEEFKRTSDFKQPDDARNAIYKLDSAQVMADLKAVQRYAQKIPAANGKTAVIGFCWGGAQAFQFASEASKLEAALVFYGTSPDAKAIKKISAPVYAFYGENDQRINAGIEATSEEMEKRKKVFEYEVYRGAGHAFMKHGDDPEGNMENKQARNDAWLRLKKILAGIQ